MSAIKTVCPCSIVIIQINKVISFILLIFWKMKSQLLLIGRVKEIEWLALKPGTYYSSIPTFQSSIPAVAGFRSAQHFNLPSFLYTFSLI